MKIHLLSGFLGSGKTTAVQHGALALLQQGIKVGVITNDQGIQLVDGDYFKSLGVANRQVLNGCFCCNYHHLDNSIQSLMETNDTEIIFAESAGSCTDIVATVLKPLLQFRPGATITISTFADVRLLQMILQGNHSFDETVQYIYLKQLEEAAVIVVNKIDLITEETLQQVKQLMQEKYADKILLYQNSLDNDCIQQWLQLLSNEKPAEALPSLNIDYDIYAEGEARLAWLDQTIEIYSATGNALQHAEDLVNNIYKAITAKQYSIGHLKFLLNHSLKISFTSGDQPLADIKIKPAETASVLINIRVETSPEKIKTLVEEVFKEEEIKTGCKIVVNDLAAFQPGYPIPVHRISN